MALLNRSQFEPSSKESTAYSFKWFCGGARPWLNVETWLDISNALLILKTESSPPPCDPEIGGETVAAAVENMSECSTAWWPSFARLISSRSVVLCPSFNYRLSVATVYAYAEVLTPGYCIEGRLFV